MSLSFQTFSASNNKDTSSDVSSDDLLSKMAEIGARSAWSLHRWDVMDSFVQLIPVGACCIIYL
jgi:hypothetical protein